MKDHIKSEKEQEMKISDTHDPKEEGAEMFGLDMSQDMPVGLP